MENFLPQKTAKHLEEFISHFNEREANKNIILLAASEL